MTARAVPDAAGLERALQALGIPCVVDAVERLAVIVPGPGGIDMSDAQRRRRALGLLEAHGFTHLALELTDAPELTRGAAVRRA
jgi:hypothetical protein